MKCTRTTLAAAMCCMAFASGSALAAGDTHRSTSGAPASSSMDRSSTQGMGTSGHYGAHTDQHTVRQVQQALSDKGHNPGPIDGVMGPRTRSALQDYQRSQNINPGDLDARTLESLGVQASAAGRGSMGNDAGSSAGGTGSSFGGSGGADTNRSGTMNNDPAGGSSTPPTTTR